MRSHNLSGFTVAEMLISLAIVILLALTAVFSLDSNQRTDELKTAARQLSADLGAQQAKAFSAHNIKICPSVIGGENAVCENSTARCNGLCATATVIAYGLHANVSSSTYTLFAEIFPSAAPDYVLTNSDESFLNRTLSPLGTSNNVVIDSIIRSPSMAVSSTREDITFARQNGAVRLLDNTTSTPAIQVIIRLRHIKSGKTMDVQVDSVTGRISVL